jgi:uncharacterized membrane protein
MQSGTGIAPTSRRPAPQARTHALVSLAAGIVGGVIAALLGTGRAAPLIGWDALALVFCGWLWSTIWQMDAGATAAHAAREDPGRNLADLVVLGAAAASLIAVGGVLFHAGQAPGALKYMEAALALVSVFLSWALVHTVFTLKYARLYYGCPKPGGINFNEPEPPQYSDFAYLAFTIGMTFQVSDTNIGTKQIRRTALKHAWLTFPLVAVIIAASINLVSGLAK